MMDSRVTLLFTVSLLTFTAVLTILAAPTAEAAYNACSVDFRSNTEGYGGVEICEIGYPCGVADGVCPQNFSLGSHETNKSFYTNPLVKRPAPPSGINTDTTPFTDGNAACQRLGGTCVGMESKSSRNGTFTSSSATCSDAATSLSDNEYHRAVCQEVPNVAGCENCPDPDCMSRVGGYVTDAQDDPLPNATVQLTNANNNKDSAYFLERTNEDGEVTIDGASGWFNVTCGKEFYNERRYETYIQPEGDTVACTGLEAAACSNDCTAPNEYGQEVCFAQCVNSASGCTNFQTQCAGLPAEDERVTDRINDTHVEVTQCCSGPTTTRYQPIASFQPNSTEVDSLEITEYRRELNGTPVTIKVATYDDE
jgi:hypothetical protein